VPGVGAVPVVANVGIDGPVAVLACALCELGAVAAVRIVEVVTDWDALMECGGTSGGGTADVATATTATTSPHGGLRPAASAAASSADALLRDRRRAGCSCDGTVAAG